MYDVVIVSDHDRLLIEAGFTRPARQVERVLLTVEGVDVPADQEARVTRLSYSVHRVDFPGVDLT